MRFCKSSSIASVTRRKRNHPPGGHASEAGMSFVDAKDTPTSASPSPIAYNNIALNPQSPGIPLSNKIRLTISTQDPVFPKIIPIY